MNSYLKVFLLALVFLLGLYTYSCNYGHTLSEPFSIRDDCPNILIQKGSELYLKNTKKAEVPGVNPMKFNNLEEYIEYMQWQQSQGIKCPILFLQHTYNTQGDNEYRIRPGPLNLEGGLEPNNDMKVNISGRDITERGAIESSLDSMQLDRLSVQPHAVEKSLLHDSHRDDKPFNVNQYPGMDLNNQYIGLEVPLDDVYNHHKSKKKSPNAMDTNWGGVKYSREVVDSGVFDENARKKD